MENLSHLEFDHVPELREPILVAAFAGWNDAANAATFAAETLRDMWPSEQFASIDPEEFFDFTETRPIISLTLEGERALEWPENLFYAVKVPESDHDLVVLIGNEPQLRWRTFCGIVLSVAEELHVSCLVTLGALLADVPHTVDPRISGFVNTDETSHSLHTLRVKQSSYEGPTGIVGVLHDAWASTDHPSVSFWGNVPHYISATPNPNIALALLQRVSSVLGIDLPLEPLIVRSSAFRQQIDEALQDNPEAKEYVEQLERHFTGESTSEVSPQLIEELERYLRSRRPPEPGATDLPF